MTASALVGYARTSTTDQKAGLEAQLRDLELAGCTKVFREEISSVATNRPQLAAVLEWVREGDTLVVTKLDRLARSVADLVAITAALKAKGAGLRILAMNLDTATPTGKLMLNLLGSIAEFERELMLERQREGIAKAKADGKYVGRQPTARRQAGEALRLRAEGKSPADIMASLGISRASFYRIVRSSHQG
ncbi:MULTISPECIES: recombinase family protein [Mesorhizobium]|nr:MULTISPECIES: recombinase family protein [Mesorhizobium]MBE1706728.1 recombinase family protein [Mesorhizobium japonicum]MBE1714761.1 recombinase family protein [Mesorhizobium japonicum]MUT22923.1 recombinase family protein [Mesorhizobium japonicum]MUT27037.1 recombinase family protein [Mesorhizobium japonicum]PBB16014.1 DNA invertase [Mesorhizobium loti]